MMICDFSAPRRFMERRGIVPGECPLFDTAVDTDDGNSVLRERARKALHGSIVSAVKAGVKAREIRRGADAEKVATVIIAIPEGAIMRAHGSIGGRVRHGAGAPRGLSGTEIRFAS